MALTPNLTTVTVSGTYVDIQGNPIAGQVNFTPRAILTDASYDQIVIAKTISVTLDANGSFSTTLPVTDDTSLSPYNFTYSVEEAFSGGRIYDIAIPSSAAATGLNLADVAPSSASAGLSSTYVLLSSYSTLNTQVQGMVATVNTASAPATAINTATTAATAAATSAASTAATAAENLRYIHPFLLMGV